MKVITIIGIVILLFSCKDGLHRSQLKQEYGIVLAKQYRGETNQSGTSIGISSSGHAVVGIVNIHESEKFDVVFRCQHGILFTINDAKIYEKMSEGDSVEIDFYELLNKNNELKDFEFVDANRKL